MNSLPTDAAARKAAPMAEGLLWYFPNALAAVAQVSKAGNDQHNPGEPMHHARGKSSDHADCILRHLVDAGKIDSDGQRHTAKVAWRALALLQEELEREEGAPLPRNAWLPNLGAILPNLGMETPNNLCAPAGNAKDVSDSTHELIPQESTCELSGMEHAP